MVCETGACLEPGNLFFPELKMKISTYRKRLSRDSVLRMRRHRNGGIVDDAVEGGKDLALQAEQPTSTVPPALVVMLISAAPVNNCAISYTSVALWHFDQAWRQSSSFRTAHANRR